MNDAPSEAGLAKLPLPMNWAWVTIADLMPEFQNGESSRGQAGGLPTVVLRLADIVDGKISLEEVRRLPLPGSSLQKYSLEPGDILVIRVNGSTQLVGRFVLADVGDVIYCDHFIRMRVSSALVDPTYLTLLASSSLVRSQIERSFVSTAGQKTINQQHIKSIAMPLPPRLEQERIVAAIEEQFSRIDVGVAALGRVRQNLTRLRHVAFSGLADSASDWTTLGAIADVVGGITKDAKRQADPSFVEVPYLRVANVQRGYLDLDVVTTIRVPIDKARKLRLEPGDVLFNEGGDRDKLGRGWIWQGQIVDCIHQNHVFRARLSGKSFEPKFVSMHGNTFGREWFEHMGKQTTNLASLSLKTLKSFPVPVLPIAEQRLRVAKIEQSASLIEALDVAVKDALRRSEQLRSVILFAAFSGTLVSQDPSDEPASTLLERIAAQRASSNGRQPARKAIRMKVTA